MATDPLAILGHGYGPKGLTEHRLADLLSHAEWVENLALQLVRDPNRAQDVVQETWFAALRQPPQDTQEPRAWLGTVARNMARRLMRTEERRSARERAVARDEAVRGPEEVVARAGIQHELVSHVLSLEEPYRSVLLLHYFEDLSAKEIAELLSSRPSTVRTQLARGLSLLRERLDQGEGGRESWIGAMLPLSLRAWRRGGAVSRTAGWSGILFHKLALLALPLLLFALIAGIAISVGPQARSLSVLATPSVGPDAAPSDGAGVKTSGAAKRPPVDQRMPQPSPTDLATPATAATLGVSGKVVDIQGRPVADLDLFFSEARGRRAIVTLTADQVILSGDRNKDAVLRVPTLHVLDRKRASTEEGLADLIARFPQHQEHLQALLRPETLQAPRVRTDAEGHYALGQPVAELLPYSMDPSWKVIGRRTRKVEGGARALDLCVAPTQNLGGVVLDQRGRPIAGAIVSSSINTRLLDSLPPQLSFEGHAYSHAFSDDNGEFHLWGGPVWEHLSVTACAKGFHNQRVQIDPAQSGWLRFELKANEFVTLSGHVLGPEGKPLAGALVCRGPAQVATDASGSFRIETPRHLGRMSLVAKAPGYVPVFTTTDPLISDQEDFRFELSDPTLNLRVRLIDGDGLPIEGYEVHLFDAPDVATGVHGSFEEAGFLSDADGSLELRELLPRNYILAILDPETLALHLTEPIPAELGFIEIPVPAPAVIPWVHGVVLNGKEQPMPGVKVSWYVATSNLQWPRKRMGESVRTNDRGEFVFTRLVPRATLQATPEGDTTIKLSPERWNRAIGPTGDGTIRFVVNVLAYVHVNAPTALAKDKIRALDARGEIVSIGLRSPNGSSRPVPQIELGVQKSDAWISVPLEARVIELLRDDQVINRASINLQRGERIQLDF